MWLLLLTILGIASAGRLGHHTDHHGSNGHTDHGSGGRCVEGSTFKVDCNDCACSNGVAICTQKACPPIDGSTGGRCVEGSTFKVDCNDCTCINGAASCTRRACPPTQPTPGACIPGTTRQVDCNTCTCGTNGVEACTFQLCSSGVEGPTFPGGSGPTFPGGSGPTFPGGSGPTFPGGSGGSGPTFPGGSGPTFPGGSGPTFPGGSGDLGQTVTVTETAGFVTQTVVEPVTLIKTQTIDQFETVTVPNYASVLVSVTNIVKQTQTVTEEEVIRSPVAGAIVVNTIPVPSETVINVQARTTNYFVQTVTDQVSQPQTHFVTIHSIRTNTVNNPSTSTITQVISQTRVSTVYRTSVVGSTVYVTSTSIITIGSGGGTTTVPAGYY